MAKNMKGKNVMYLKMLNMCKTPHILIAKRKHNTAQRKYLGTDVTYQPSGILGNY